MEITVLVQCKVFLLENTGLTSVAHSGISLQICYKVMI